MAKYRMGEKRVGKPVNVKLEGAAALPKLFRFTLEVNNLERAKLFYEELLGIKGKKIAGQRMHFDCGGMTLQIADVSASGPSHPNARSVYFSVPNLDAMHKRAKKMKCLSLELVHDRAGGAIYTRPWGERSFYCDDPWFNSLCFVEAGTETK